MRHEGALRDPRYIRRDANEKPIIQALEWAGCRVWRIERSKPSGVPDLLVIPGRGKHAGVSLLLEVKLPKGKLEPSQADFFAYVCRVGGKAYVVRSVDEALRAIGAIP